MDYGLEDELLACWLCHTESMDMGRLVKTTDNRIVPLCDKCYREFAESVGKVTSDAYTALDVDKVQEGSRDNVKR